MASFNYIICCWLRKQTGGSESERERERVGREMVNKCFWLAAVVLVLIFSFCGIAALLWPAACWKQGERGVSQHDDKVNSIKMNH